MNQTITSPLTRFFCSMAMLVVLVTNGEAQSADKVIKQAVKAMTNGKGEKALREPDRCVCLRLATKEYRLETKR